MEAICTVMSMVPARAARSRQPRRQAATGKSASSETPVKRLRMPKCAHAQCIRAGGKCSAHRKNTPSGQLFIAMHIKRPSFQGRVTPEEIQKSEERRGGETCDITSR